MASLGPLFGILNGLIEITLRGELQDPTLQCERSEGQIYSLIGITKPYSDDKLLIDYTVE